MSYAFHLCIRYRTFAFKNIFVLKHQQRINILSPIVECKVTTFLYSHLCTRKKDINKPIQILYLLC